MASPAGLPPDQIGVVPPPPGITPNFKNPQYHSGGIVPLACVFIPLAAIFMALRVYTKVRIIKVFGLEDWTIIVAYLCTVFISIDCLVQQKYGNGIHEWDITLAKLIPYSKVRTIIAASTLTIILLTHFQWGAASVVIYVPAVGLAKVAILLFYLRLNPERGFRTAVYVSLLLTTSYVLALSFAILFECSPVAKFWNPLLEGECVDSTKLYLANAILNVIFDFVVLLVPVPMLRKLQIPRRQKLVIAGLFSLGSITCIVSAVRIYFQQSVLAEKDDLSWHIVTPTSLVFVECNLSIICGCVMVLRPFLRRHLPKVLGGYDYRRYRSPGPRGAYDGPHGPNSRSGYKIKVSTGGGYGKGGSSAGRSWPGMGLKKNNTRSNSDDTAVDGDIEMGGWPSSGEKKSNNNKAPPPRSESEENIIGPPAEAAVAPASPLVIGDPRRDHAPGILKTIDVDVR
ncbi:MAG: hypothetical protein Q9219_004859 [cf. Caloplaca sp. 3 TL-2023]